MARARVRPRARARVGVGVKVRVRVGLACGDGSGRMMCCSAASSAKFFGPVRVRESERTPGEAGVSVSSHLPSSSCSGCGTASPG